MNTFELILKIVLVILFVIFITTILLVSAHYGKLLFVLSAFSAAIGTLIVYFAICLIIDKISDALKDELKNKRDKKIAEIEERKKAEEDGN